MLMPKLTLAAFMAGAIRSSLAQDAPTLNIVDTAVAAGSFTSLSEFSSLRLIAHWCLIFIVIIFI